MATRLAEISSHHVQTVVSEDTHRQLRNLAYDKKTPMKDILRDLITKFAQGKVVFLSETE